jgi:hypothetical protein
MWRMHVLRGGRAAAVAAVISVLGMSANTMRADEVVQPVKAVWQVQEIYLSYFGFTSYYSCDALRDKVQIAILQLGAYEGSLVTAAGCTELVGPERMPGTRIVLVTPIAATPEAVAAMAKDTKRAELIAKLQKKGGAALDTGEFDAVRKVVVLNTKQGATVSADGDCELLEHIRNQVVKKMDARVVKDDLGCTPHQGTVGNRKLQVEVLVKT